MRAMLLVASFLVFVSIISVLRVLALDTFMIKLAILKLKLIA